MRSYANKPKLRGRSRYATDSLSTRVALSVHRESILAHILTTCLLDDLRDLILLVTLTIHMTTSTIKTIEMTFVEIITTRNPDDSSRRGNNPDSDDNASNNDYREENRSRQDNDRERNDN